MSIHYFSPFRLLPNVIGACVWNLLATISVLHISLASSYCCNLFRISYTDTCLLPPLRSILASLFLFTKVHLSFGFGSRQIRVIREECKRLQAEFEEGFMAQKGLWNIAKKRQLDDRRALPKEDGELLREYQAMHEENFLSSRLRKDVERKEEERKRLNEEAEREEGKSVKIEVRVRGQGSDQKNAFGPCLAKCSRIRSISEVESFGWGFFWVFGVCSCCVSVCACVTFLFLNANVVCKVVFFGSDCEFVESREYHAHENLLQIKGKFGDLISGCRHRFLGFEI